MTTILNKEKILKIPELRKTLSVLEISVKLGVKERTIRYWIARLRKEGIKVVKSKGGRKAIDLGR